MKRFIKTILATALCACFAQANAAKNNPVTVSPEEKEKIEEVVHQYLISKPEVLIEAMQVLQKKQMDQAEATVKQTQKIASTFAKSLFTQSDDPIAGNPNGKVSIVEFFDYQCSHCVDMAPVVERIIKANPDVRVVFKEFPIRGPVSELAARAALAANKQGKYYQFSHALLTANKPLTQDIIFEIAKTNGLDVEKLKKDMTDKAIDEQLKANMKLAQDLKLFGTPAFFIGKTDANGNINYIAGFMEQKQMQTEIDKVSK